MTRLVWLVSLLLCGGCAGGGAAGELGLVVLAGTLAFGFVVWSIEGGKKGRTRRAAGKLTNDRETCSTKRWLKKKVNASTLEAGRSLRERWGSTIGFPRNS